MKVVFMLRISI